MNIYQIPEDEKKPVVFRWFGDEEEYRSAEETWFLVDTSPIVSFLSKHPEYGKDTDEQNV